MNKDVTKIERSVYNVLTLLGDIGGLTGILFSFGVTLQTYINYQKLENYLVEKLYIGNEKGVNR